MINAFDRTPCMRTCIEKEALPYQLIAVLRKISIPIERNEPYRALILPLILGYSN
jgi:hypothetical protein